jgi:hypothetical protein
MSGSSPVRLSLVALITLVLGVLQPALADHMHHTVWEGRYQCPQGVTGVRLLLDVASDGATTGSFEFGPVKENPGVPSGSYLVRGQVKMLGGGAFALVLVPVRWTRRPPGYLMVGFTARSDRERRSMHGKIANEACAQLDVSRLD